MEQEKKLRLIIQKALTSDLSEILNYILEGSVSPLFLLRNDRLKERFISLIENEWDDIIDVTMNPFWKLNEITRHEKESALQKILKKTEQVLRVEVHALLNTHYSSCLSTYFLQLAYVKNCVAGISKDDQVSTSTSISKLRDRVSELHEAITAVEKTRIALLFFEEIIESEAVMHEVNTDELLKSDKTDFSKYEIYEWDWNNGIELIRNEQPNTLIPVEYINAGPQEKDKSSDKLIFKRTKLSGGIVYSSSGKQVDYLNELVSRSLNLQHNDELRLRRISETGIKEYEVVEKAGGINPDRIVYQYCIANINVVEQKVLISQHIVGGARRDCLLIEGTTYQFQFNLNDLSYLKIEDGSIVDIAYWRGKPHTAKIIWNHPSKGSS